MMLVILVICRIVNARKCRPYAGLEECRSCVFDVF